MSRPNSLKMRGLVGGCLGIIGTFCLVSPASAQITSYTLNYYNAGAPSPVQSQGIAGSAPVCNQAVPAPTSATNPTKTYWDDPTNAGRFCVYVFVAADKLFSLPVGNYEGTLIALNGTLSSPESNRAPFTEVAAPPPAPTNVHIVKDDGGGGVSGSVDDDR